MDSEIGCSAAMRQRSRRDWGEVVRVHWCLQSAAGVADKLRGAFQRQAAREETDGRRTARFQAYGSRDITCCLTGKGFNLKMRCGILGLSLI